VQALSTKLVGLERRAVRIRDPIHGTLPVSADETAVVDSPYYQRLRHVRQLGFGELAFPGATHTRHAHGLGAMHVVGRLFDGIAARAELPEATRARFRSAVRLATLCHDLGHMPLSHASERIAPQKATLQLPAWVAEPEGQASHEDFTALLLLKSNLAELLQERLKGQGLGPEALAALVSGRTPPGGLDFTHAGADWTPLLRSLVSGELDADRMDYLLRDSFYTGVNYGRFDLDWLIQNLHAARVGDRMELALSRSAAFAFEDFLLSRYHMFLSVYLHHTPVAFDWMLAAFYRESRGEFEIPSEPTAFLYCDDVALMHALRRSTNRWARRIVARSGFKLLAQFTERDEGYDLGALAHALDRAGVEHFEVESESALSKYFDGTAGPSLYILDEPSGRLTPVARYTPLYQRYAGAVRLSRVYVQPDQLLSARAALSAEAKAVP
jgi:HD superfamily phosphohydrolase